MGASKRQSPQGLDITSGVWTSDYLVKSGQRSVARPLAAVSHADRRQRRIGN